MGYTTQQRRDVSDASAGVTGEQVHETQVATLEEALRGRVAGVQISASGEPGRPADVVIRGQNFLSNAAPLYVVAGQTHPRVLARDGERYRDSLRQRAAELGVADMLRFEPGYLGMDRHILTKDTGAAIGLIAGIILGSLLLNLTGSY